MKKILSILFFLSVVALPAPAIAQNVDILNDICKDPQARSASACAEKEKKVLEDGKAENPLYGPQGIITRVVNIMSIMVGIAAVIGIMVAGLKYITNGNNPQEVTQARDLIIYAVIGLVLAALAQVLVRTVLTKAFPGVVS